MHKHYSAGKPFENKVSSSKHTDFCPNNYQMMNSRHILTHRIFFLKLNFKMYARVCTHVCRQEEDVDVFPSPFFLRQHLTM